MFGRRRYSILASVAFAVLAGCAAHQSEPPPIAAAIGCSWMHASYEIKGRSGAVDFAVARDVESWIPLTSNGSLMNPEVSAFLHADGMLDVRMRTDRPGGGKESQTLWLGPPIMDAHFPMYGEITRQRPNVEPGGWPEYNLFPGVDVIGRVFVTCRGSQARGMPPNWDSFAA